MYLDDFVPRQPVHFAWSSNAKTGGSITTAIAGQIVVHRGSDSAETNAGVTDIRDFDGRIGIHKGIIDTSNAFYLPHNDYTILLVGATIDGETVNAVINTFSILNRSHSIQMKSGTVSAAFPATNIRFQSDNVTEKTGYYDGRGVYGGYGSSMQRQVGVIDTYLNTNGRGDFNLASPMTDAFAAGEPFTII